MFSTDPCAATLLRAAQRVGLSAPSRLMRPNHHESPAREAAPTRCSSFPPPAHASPRLSSPRPTSRAWCACALTCRAWLPRSRFNLFYEVQLRSERGVDLLVRALAEYPSFADMIYRLTIDQRLTARLRVAKDFIPFARLTTLPCMRRCRFDASAGQWLKLGRSSDRGGRAHVTLALIPLL